MSIWLWIVTLIMGPPLWSSGQTSWLQIQRSGFDSRRCQIFWEVVSLERGPLSLVSTIGELLGRKSSGSGIENLECGCKDPSRWPCCSVCPQMLALTSATSGCRWVCIVRSRIRPRRVKKEFCMPILVCLAYSGASRVHVKWIGSSAVGKLTKKLRQSES
jgi:hypothetical protein